MFSTNKFFLPLFVAIWRLIRQPGIYGSYGTTIPMVYLILHFHKGLTTLTLLPTLVSWYFFVLGTNKSCSVCDAIFTTRTQLMKHAARHFSGLLCRCGFGTANGVRMAHHLGNNSPSPRNIQTIVCRDSLHQYIVKVKPHHPQPYVPRLRWDGSENFFPAVIALIY